MLEGGAINVSAEMNEWNRTDTTPNRSMLRHATTCLADAGGKGARGDQHRRRRIQPLLRIDAVALAVVVVVQAADLAIVHEQKEECQSSIPSPYIHTTPRPAPRRSRPRPPATAGADIPSPA